MKGGADFHADGIGGRTKLRKPVAIGQLRAEHQPRERRAFGDEPHIGRADLGDPVGFASALRGGGDDLAAQFHKPFGGEFDQQRFVARKVAIGCGMADACPARHRAQAEIGERFLFQQRARRIEQRVAQIAMMIGTYAGGIVQDLLRRSFSSRANRLDVSQRLPPIVSTSA